MIKVPCEQVFEEMFTGKINDMKNERCRDTYNKKKSLENYS